MVTGKRTTQLGTLEKKKERPRKGGRERKDWHKTVQILTVFHLGSCVSLFILFHILQVTLTIRKENVIKICRHRKQIGPELTTVAKAPVV